VILAVVAFMAPSASQVLANVQQHYATIPELTVEFVQKVVNTTFGTTQTSQGTLYLAKPNLFRTDYVKGKPPKPTREFIFNGATLWIIDHANLQVIKNSAPGAVLPAVGSFLTGGNLAAANTVTLTGNTLTLVPKQSQAGVKQLELVVDPQTWDVVESIVTDPSGDVNDFAFTSPRTTKLAATTFVFNSSSLPSYKLVVVPPAAAAAGPAAPTKAAVPAVPTKPAAPTAPAAPTKPASPAAPATPPKP